MIWYDGSKYVFSSAHCFYFIWKKQPKYPEKLNYLIIECEDMPFTDLYPYFDLMCAFIAHAVRSKSGNLLVHCAAGCSRSVTALIAYFIKHRSWTITEAMMRIKARREWVGPNSGFMSQLAKWQECFREQRQSADLKLASKSTSTSSSESFVDAETIINSSAPKYPLIVYVIHQGTRHEIANENLELPRKIFRRQRRVHRKVKKKPAIEEPN